ncbi:MFS transporter [Embleya scabrispora]|uniref:MFS transporter n=1 Tax=Embleya scabrispora TaxID=159449 RepID=A0A1T3P3A1_9ACTN|nr:MFS transporter [Embleya scabrispora]OPC83553.1 MFS transporter [Embleya scabrispora]
MSPTDVRHAPAPAVPASVPPAPASPARIGLAAWPVTAVFVLSNAATPLYVLWRRELGFSSGTSTVIFAAYIVGLLGALTVAGVLSDRIGRKPVLLPALGLAALACLLFATAASVPALVAARLLTGIAVGATVSAGMAAVADIAGSAHRRLAALAASSAMVLGAGLGPMLAGGLSETVPGPTSTVFVVEAVLLATAFAVVYRLPLARPATAPPAAARWFRVPSVPAAGRGRLLLGIAVFAPGITATSFVLSLGPTLLADLLDTSSRIVAGATAFAMFAAATGAQFAVRRWAVRTVLLAGAAAIAAGMIVLIAAVHLASAPLLITAAILAGAGQGLGQLGGLTLLGAHVPRERAAEANAALSVGGYLPAGLLPVAAGYLSDAVGLRTGTTTFAAVLIGAATVAAALVLTNRAADDRG